MVQVRRTTSVRARGDAAADAVVTAAGLARARRIVGADRVLGALPVGDPSAADESARALSVRAADDHLRGSSPNDVAAALARERIARGPRAIEAPLGRLELRASAVDGAVQLPGGGRTNASWRRGARDGEEYGNGDDEREGALQLHAAPNGDGVDALHRAPRAQRRTVTQPAPAGDISSGRSRRIAARPSGQSGSPSSWRRDTGSTRSPRCP